MMETHGKYHAVLAARKASVFCLFMVLSIFYFLPVSLAGEIGTMQSIEGNVSIMREGRLPSLVAEKGTVVFSSDIIRTKSGSKAEIIFHDGNVVRIAEKSRININEYVGGSKGSIFLSTGKMEAVVNKEITKRIAAEPGAHRFEIKTPNAVAGVRGTEYLVTHDDNTTEVIVKRGSVSVHHPLFPSMVSMVTGGHGVAVVGNKIPEQMLPVSSDEIRKHEKDVTPDKGQTAPSSQAPDSSPRQELQKFLNCNS